MLKHTVYSLRVANILMKRGYIPFRIEKNKRFPNLEVFVFEADVSFYTDLNEILSLLKKKDEVRIK